MARFRLDAQHYINDRLLEPGHIVGDDTDVPLVAANGEPIKPSVSMTPLDEDAWALFNETFPGARRPDRDPTKAIPIRGSGDSAKQAPLVNVQKGPDGMVQQQGGPVKTVGDVPGGYVEGHHNELKKGLPDSGSPNHPVGQPVIGTQSAPGTTPVVPPKPEDPSLRVNAPAGEQKAVAEAQAKAQAEANAKAAGSTPQGKK
jgi:hypothetical protein